MEAGFVWQTNMMRPSWRDRVFAGVMLAVLSPVLLLAAVAVLLSGPGEVLVRVPIVREDGRMDFQWAFRVSPQFEPARYDVMARRRLSWITPVGRVLRRLGLSRLPSLLDVAAGRLGLSEALAA